MGQIRDGRAVVAAGGTRVRLVNDPTPAQWLWIQADETNTAVVVVGGANVVAAAATRAGVTIDEVGAFEEKGVYIPGPLDLTDVWIDSPSPAANQGVHFMYMEP